MTDLAGRVGTLLRPTSVAVVGASDKPGVGQRVVANLRAVGFGGVIYPVNPRHAEVAGIPAHRSLSALPRVPDLVVAAVNRELTVSVVREANGLGCGAAVLLAAGFGEAGPHGQQLQSDLVQSMGQMAVLGPNCLGYVNLADRTAGYSGPLMEPPACGRTALVSQSGAFAATVTGAAAERAIAFSHVITTGNQVGLDVADHIGFLARQPAVRVIACYVEGFTDGRKLVAAMDEAVQSGQHVIVLKAGRSRAGGAAARTHTGALAGSSAVQLGLWRQHGVLVAADPEEFLALIELCSRLTRLPGPRVGVVTISGGERLLAADAAEEFGLPLASITPATGRQLAQVLPPFITVSNPMDTTGAGVVDGQPEAHARAVSIFCLDPNVDVVVASQDAKNGWVQADHASSLFYQCVVSSHQGASAAGKPLVVISPTAGELDSSMRDYASRHGIPCLAGLRPAVSALSQLVRSQFDLQSDGAGDAGLRPPPDGWQDALSGHKTLERLRDNGIAVWPSSLARTQEEALQAAGRLGYPVALKIDGPALPHRSSVGGVRLDLANEAAVLSAWQALSERAAAGGIRTDGMLVQPMAPDGIEVFVGGLRDEQFGPVVLCGPGGAQADRTAAPAIALAPLSADAARDLLRFAGINGMRAESPDGPTASINAVATTISQLSQLIAEDDVVALDVNPLIVSSASVALIDAKLVRVSDRSTRPARSGPAPR
jgi:acetate---CoA ligase (ADP-forming)